MLKILCDRCKTQIMDATRGKDLKLTVADTNRVCGIVICDLCEKCAKGLWNWWHSTEKNNDS